MRRPRRNHSPAFKAKVAKEALKGTRTIAEIADKHDIASPQVSAWKTELESRLEQIFEGKGTENFKQRELEKRCEKLERKVGQLVIEKDWLEKKCEELGI